MIEAALCNYLQNNLELPVYAERPENPPGAYYLIDKIGGGGSRFVHKSTFAIQSIVKAEPSNSKESAMILNEDLKGAMISDNGGALNISEVTKVELNGDYDFTDPESKEYRYQAVYEICHY